MNLALTSLDMLRLGLFQFEPVDIKAIQGNGVPFGVLRTLATSDCCEGIVIPQSLSTGSSLF
ncbi:hypothetical protein VPHD292_0053 [Vibrio phage D292]